MMSLRPTNKETPRDRYYRVSADLIELQIREWEERCARDKALVASQMAFFVATMKRSEVETAILEGRVQDEANLRRESELRKAEKKEMIARMEKIVKVSK